MACNSDIEDQNNFLANVCEQLLPNMYLKFS